MAVGWAQDGAVHEQIEASISDELARMKAAQRKPVGESFTECAECGDEIPPARREAIPGVKLCLECQGARDRRPALRGGINRRASKDSQLR